MSESNKNNETTQNEENQKNILAEIQSKQMRQILLTHGLVDRVKEGIKRHSPQWDFSGDSRPVVSKSNVGLQLPDGTWQEKENLQVGIERVFDSEGTASTGIATVAFRMDTHQGKTIHLVGGFTQEDAELVATCVDELGLAQASGQIPNLSNDFSRIYIPRPETPRHPF